MPLAIFGISNNGLNLVVTLFMLMLVVVWLALIVYTYLDARRRVSDPFLVACATIASFIPYIGTAVYAILRPPEFLEDAHERELEIRAAELRVRQLTEQLLPQLRVPGREELPALPELPAPAQGPLPELRQAGRPALGGLPLLRDRAGARAPRAPASRRPPGASARGEPLRRAAAADAPRGRRRKREPAPQAQTSSEPPRTEPATRAADRRRRPAKRPKRSTSREPDPDPRQA